MKKQNILKCQLIQEENLGTGCTNSLYFTFTFLDKAEIEK